MSFIFCLTNNHNLNEHCRVIKKTFCAVFHSSASDIINGDEPPVWETQYGLPFFDNTTSRDVMATVGQSAKLHCRVRNLGDRAVSIFSVYHAKK